MERRVPEGDRKGRGGSASGNFRRNCPGFNAKELALTQPA